MANKSNIIYAIEVCQFRAKSDTARCHWNGKCQEGKLWGSYSVVGEDTSLVENCFIPTVNRYWHTKGACCCHVLGLRSL